MVVDNCLLTLRGYKDPASKPGVFVTGEIGVTDTHAQTYSKYLVRMRADKGNGISAIALLWPQANVWPPEIDFATTQGSGQKEHRKARTLREKAERVMRDEMLAFSQIEGKQHPHSLGRS